MKTLIKYPFVIYGTLGLLIMGPMLLPGYVFTLDMVFGPEMRLPSEVTASYPFYVLIKVLSLVTPMQIIQKLLLLSIIILSGMGAYRLTRYLLQSDDTTKAGIAYGAYFAGLLYVVNPFTYVRFMDGHFAVLLGYAVLPFFTRALFELLFGRKFRWQTSLRLALYAVIIGILSVHALGYMAILSLAAIGIFVFQHRRQQDTLLAGIKYLGLAMMLFLVLNSYWLIPTLTSNTPRETVIQSFDRRHFLSFRTDGANDVSVIGNVLAMYGYWGDREGRYVLPRNVSPLWPVFFMGILAIAVYGLYRTRRNAASLTLTLSTLTAAVLAVGIAAVPFSHINEWLIEAAPFFRGYREPQKFISILALFYAIMGGIGVAHLQTSRLIQKLRQDYRAWLMIVILAIPLLYTPTFLGGFVGQLHSRSYPSDWKTANDLYASKSQGKVLFLPWHQYMYFDFTGRVVANPTTVYFEGDLITGDNAEIGLLNQKTNDPTSQLIEQTLLEKNPERFSTTLGTLGIEYIFLSKNADWQQYQYLDQMKLELVNETKTLKIYRNRTFSQH